MSTDWIDVDGNRLECRRIGPVGGVALVLLHEGLGCVELWRDVPERLAEAADLEVFVFSRLGYGKSDPCDLPRPVTFMHTEGRDVLPRVLDAAGIEECILVGHSDGGTISLVHAGSTAGGRVKGVVTLAAHVFNEDITVRSIEEAKVAYETTDLREKLARYHGENVDCAFRGWNDVWLHPDFRAWNVEEFLPEVTVPVLAIQGANDRYGTWDQVEAIVSGVAGPAESLMVPDCGHSPHLEAKDEVVAAIAAFARRVLLTSRRDAPGPGA